MNAVGVYVQTAQLLLRPSCSGNSAEQFNDLNRLLGNLRQLLACAVCSRLLSDPFAPRDRNCQHNVCRLCIRGRKCLLPPCIDCKDCQDFKTYVENPQMRCLLLCFKSLCEHILEAQPIFQQLCKQKPTMPVVVSSQPSTVPVALMSTQEYIVEGASYSDISSAFATDLPRATPARVPRLHVPSPALHILAHTQAAPKVPTPPISNSASIVIKQEQNTSITSSKTSPPPPPPLSAVNNAILTATHNTQPRSMKHYVKHIPSLSPVTTSTQHTKSPIAPTIAYVGPNTPGVVVPIVSSSVTTAAPLSIASSRLQSLNRQLAQARRTTNTSGCDTVPPLAFKVSLAPTSSASIQTYATPSTATATTTATLTSQQMPNPPPIKTVSNGSAMYSVLYTGIGNKITIKRKTDGDEDLNQKKSVSTATSTSSIPKSGTIFRQVSITKPPNPNKRRGCRCGNATPTPGKLTCCGQRCPCYVDSKSCIGCKCRGCRNPHRPDGGKVRPVIPELACYEIQMADESTSLSPHDSPITNVASLPILQNATSPQQQQHKNLDGFKATLQATQLNLVSQINASSSNSCTTMTPPATLIPFRSLQSNSQLERLSALSGSGSTQQTHIATQTLGTSNISTPPNSTANTLKLENFQRESVLIQNSDGNYQVVNVFTTGSNSTHATNTAQLQRIHTINNTSSISTTPTNNTSGLQQIFFQQRQHALPQRIITSSTTNTPSPSPPTSIATMPLTQLQHQLKKNIIAVHPLTTNHQQQQHRHQSQQHHHPHITTRSPLISPSNSANATTITLSPIIVTSPTAALTTDMFSSSEGSVDDFITINSITPATTITSPNISNGSLTTTLLPMSANTTDSTQFGTISLDGTENISTILSSSRNITAMGNRVQPTAHLTPALVEVIDSSEL